jgi:hypothetical protein
MNRIEYKLDYEDVSKLEEKFKKLPGRVEHLINSYLHTQGAEKVARDVTAFIRVSKKSKRHAKHHKWWKVRPHNLGFEIVAKGGAAKNKGSYGYLIFPNEGRGPRNPLEQRFFERGLEKATPRILEDLNRLIDKKIEEELS